MSASDSEHGGQRTQGRISLPAPSARRLPPSPVVRAQRVAAEHKQVRSLAYGAPLLELPADTQPDDAIDLTGDEDWSTQRTYSLPPLPHTSQSRSAPLLPKDEHASVRACVGAAGVSNRTCSAPVVIALDDDDEVDSEVSAPDERPHHLARVMAPSIARSPLGSAVTTPCSYWAQLEATAAESRRVGDRHGGDGDDGGGSDTHITDQCSEGDDIPVEELADLGIEFTAAEVPPLAVMAETGAQRGAWAAHVAVRPAAAPPPNAFGILMAAQKPTTPTRDVPAAIVHPPTALHAVTPASPHPMRAGVGAGVRMSATGAARTPTAAAQSLTVSPPGRPFPVVTPNIARGSERDRSGGGHTGSGRSGGACPFYKRIPGTPFVVDAFHYASPTLSRHYILTHFHSDHYGGLTPSFCAGTIYCSPVTASLVKSRLGVSALYVRELALDVPHMIEGVSVTLFDANHCPGAAIFLFQTGSAEARAAGYGSAYLHVGDFRWCSAMKRYPLLRPFGWGGGHGGALRRLETLFLDTTYCSPTYTFPPQAACIAAAVQMARTYAADPGVLFLVGSYTIGKERLFMQLARAIRSRVFVNPWKYRICAQLQWDAADMALLTTDPSEARVHVVPMACLSLQQLQDRLTKERGAGLSARFAAAAAPDYDVAADRAPAAKRPNIMTLFQAAATAAAGGGGGGNPSTSTNANVQGSMPPPPTPAAAAAAARPAPARGLLAKKRVKLRGSLFADLLKESATAAADVAFDAPPSSTADASIGAATLLHVQGHDLPHPSASSVAMPCPSRSSFVGDSAGGLRTLPVSGAQPAQPRYHSIVAFRPTGWAHAPNKPSGRGWKAATSASARGGGLLSRSAATAAGGADFVDVMTQVDDADELRAGLTTWDRAEGDTAGITDFGLRPEHTDVRDVREVRAPGAVLATVMLPTQSAGGGGGTQEHMDARCAMPAAAPVPQPAGRRVYTVRLTKQTRHGGAAVHTGSGGGGDAVGHKRRHSVAGGAALPPGGVTLFSVPYSEHSSFTELQECVAWLDPCKIIPTVNCASADAARSMVTLLRGGGGAL